ncbi:torsin-1A-like [Aquila chrysaetos chrysaetos]|uniref:Torsin n=1 Tax=Aquila chrysaetos chrysaetos TaxID=223781 RepID=A0A663F1P7_AQUCH|nr:torsin-1A-like [Aquila chrysaetos chrysaetos]
MKLLNAAVVFILVPTLTPALDPLSTSVLMGSAAVAWQLLSSQSWLKCSLLECCNMKDTLNFSVIKMDLDRKVFGQHLAIEIVLRALSANMRSKRPRKPLVMSFHGWTGTGKSFVSSIIAENLYRLNIPRRKFVHHFSTVLHFPHLSHIHLYKEQLQNWIRGNVSACPRSLFIFAEMDQMPHGLIDSIMPFLGYHEEIDGVYYGKAIFIFLNNAGGDKITEIALDYWRSLKRREDIPVKKLQSLLSEEIFRNRNSGFFHSQLIQKNLIDYFIPFLPLEYKHVRQCVREELRVQGHREDEDLIAEIALAMTDYPSEERLYSSKGCKTVASRVALSI